VKAIAIIAAVLTVVARVHVTLLHLSAAPVTVPVYVLAMAVEAAVTAAVVWLLARKVRARSFWLAARCAP
jgi:hypothetical protein